MTELEEIISQLRAIGARRIILFGSQARGRARRGSDIDLLVIAEKALKAYLFSQGEEPPPTHSIARLCSAAARFDPAFQTLRSEVKKLTPYYVDARYPSALEEIPALYFEASDAEEAIRLAEKTLQAVKERFPAGSPR